MARRRRAAADGVRPRELFSQQEDAPVVATAKALKLPEAFVSRRFEVRKETPCGPIAALNTPSGQPYLLILIASVHRFNAAESTLKDELLRTAAAGVGIVTDAEGLTARCLRRRFDRLECEYVPAFQHPGPDVSGGPANWFFVNDEGRPQGPGRPLGLLTEKVEDVFFEIHSHFRDIDGLHADEALDELCKLLYAKLYDEETTPASAPCRMQRRAYVAADECAAETRALYHEAAAHDARALERRAPGSGRSRGVFASPIRLSNAALVKAVEALQGYHLGRSSIDAKGRAFQRVIGPAMRSGMGQYFTPAPVIRFLAEAAAPTLHDLILDPFCGSGHFLTACLQRVRAAHGKDDKAFHESASAKLHGIEKSERMVRIAMTDMRLHGDGQSNIRCTDALLAFSNYSDIKPESFDLILTNPPFGSILGPEAVQQLGEFALARESKTAPLEILGLERSIRLLRPGGRLGIVLPDGVLANRHTGYVREWLGRQAKLRAVVSLPIETFTPFGANIKTCLVLCRKWEAGERRTTDYAVFLARSDGVGYDATGCTTGGSDLAEIGALFADFIRSEGW